MILLHPYATHPRYTERQQETWTALRHLSIRLHRAKVRIVDLPCSEPNSYELAIKRYWGQDTLVVVEHDIVPSMQMLNHLWTCKEPLCMQAYRIPVDTQNSQALRMAEEMVGSVDADDPLRCEAIRRIGQFSDLDRDAARHTVDRHGFAYPLVHRVVMPSGHERWGRTADQFADHFALGLTKFSRSLQKAVGTDWAPGSWSNLDSRMSNYVRAQGHKVHIHFPEVKHNHVGNRADALHLKSLHLKSLHLKSLHLKSLQP